MAAIQQDDAINASTRNPLNWKVEQRSFDTSTNVKDNETNSKSISGTRFTQMQKSSIQDSAAGIKSYKEQIIKETSTEGILTIETSSSEDVYTRKIVVCTNIAETSLTVEKVKYVIDCGMAKKVHYDQQLRLSAFGLTTLPPQCGRH